MCVTYIVSIEPVYWNPPGFPKKYMATLGLNEGFHGTGTYSTVTPQLSQPCDYISPFFDKSALNFSYSFPY